MLWDRETETIVNNESIGVMRQFANVFADLGDVGDDLYRAGRRAEIDRVIDAINEPINNGVYRARFADSQSAYDAAVTELFEAPDHWVGVLADQRYLVGDRLTLAGVRLFPTLIHFDPSYHTAYRCDRQFLDQYDNLWPDLRDLYQTSGVTETVVWDHIRDQGYYQGEITPIGPDLDYEAPHHRDQLTSGAVAAAE